MSCISCYWTAGRLHSLAVYELVSSSISMQTMCKETLFEQLEQSLVPGLPVVLADLSGSSLCCVAFAAAAVALI